MKDYSKFFLSSGSIPTPMGVIRFSHYSGLASNSISSACKLYLPGSVHTEVLMLDGTSLHCQTDLV